jgi:hypothetical protein
MSLTLLIVIVTLITIIKGIFYYNYYSSGHVAIWELNFDKREASQVGFLLENISAITSIYSYF